ncbi:MAG: cytochrome c, partial [Acidimicrobiia bacterium]|nr:cytochrome c [Acidimicrobiia bacterium]
DQQLDFVIEYLRSIQLPQDELVAGVDARVDAELATLEGARGAIDTAIADQHALLATIISAPGRSGWAERLEADLAQVLDGAGGGLDTDLDGLSDDAETQINRISELAFANVGTDVTAAAASAADRLILTLDPANPFSTTNRTGDPVADERAARALLSELRSQATILAPLAANNDSIRAGAEAALHNLEAARDAKRYAVDFEQVAGDAFGGDIASARRAYGLFGAYCARCHTAGYSAGPVATLQPGSGALGPSLRDRRSIVQFPDFEDQYDFIVKGSVNGQPYGVNGIGRGWMPGFGAVLTEADIRLIVEYERSLQ